MAKLPIDDSDKFCQWLLEKFNENNETVMLAPATGFYSVPERGLQEVRISYVLNVDDMKRSMELLKKAIEVYPGRK
jgi:aspartate aminotransferase